MNKMELQKAFVEALKSRLDGSIILNDLLEIIELDMIHRKLSVEENDTVEIMLEDFQNCIETKTFQYYKILHDMLKKFEEHKNDGIDDIILRNTSTDYEEKTNVVDLINEITSFEDGTLTIESEICTLTTYGKCGSLIDKKEINLGEF